ncbi:hypothetical protein H0G86_011618 [Trichoderma simmonsii]|uniref:Uncharacterized protein n=1 Tax=Trichoderma simmonsii TaxID=1491479 RepID=A0A8G0LNS2_9HYPO|nr:hypothetical protein H0G86_011618 [Trichoderma simmonsii]
MEMGWEEIMCLFTAYNDDMTAEAQRRFLLSLPLYYFYVEFFICWCLGAGVRMRCGLHAWNGLYMKSFRKQCRLSRYRQYTAIETITFFLICFSYISTLHLPSGCLITHTERIICLIINHMQDLGTNAAQLESNS